MRRSARLGFAIAIAAVIIVVGAYSLYWLIAAQRIENGVGLWAQSLRAHDLDLAWRTSRVTGFPFAFRLELTAARLRQTRPGATPEVSLPQLTVHASPWNFRVFRFTAPDGLSAATGGNPAATLHARTAQGSVVINPDGGLRLWLGLGAPSADVGARVAARDADLWLSLPPQRPQNHDDPALGLALSVRAIALPVAPAPFRNPLDEVALALTLRGHIPDAPARQAAAAWRDAGGTLDLDRLALRWGDVAITGSGTLALDDELQPIGALSGAIEGYQALMAALVAAGRVPAGDAQIAGLALAFLSRKGPDGRRQIAASFTIQNGQLYFGRVKLGALPRIAWQ